MEAELDQHVYMTSCCCLCLDFWVLIGYILRLGDPRWTEMTVTASPLHLPTSSLGTQNDRKARVSG